MKLSDKQALALDYCFDKQHNVVVFAGSWRAGKTYLALLFALISCMKLQGVRILIGRMNYTQLVDTTLKTLQSEVLPDFGWQDKFSWNWQRKTLTCIDTKSEILFAGLDPHGGDNTLGGYTLTHAIIDEASSIDPDILDEVRGRLSYRLSENDIISKLLIVSNPDRGMLYNKYYIPYRDGKLPDDTVFIPISMHDNPFLSDEYLRQQTPDNLGDQKYRMFVIGDWEATITDRDLFFADTISACFTDRPFDNGDKRTYISVDPAGQGKDSTCIVVAKGLHVQEIVKQKKADVPTVVAKIKELQQKYHVSNSRIIIDAGGNGGHADFFNGCIRYHSNGKVLKDKDDNYQMLRDQLIFRLHQFIRDGKFRIRATMAHYQNELIDQAIAHKMANPDVDAKQRVSPKSEVKRQISESSPDLFDAIYQLMWFHVRPVVMGARSFTLT